MFRFSKLKQFVVLGLACLSCVIVINIARKPNRTIRPVMPANHADQETVRATRPSRMESDHPFVNASRIPSFDDDATRYPVAHAAHESVEWTSITTIRDRTPPTKNASELIAKPDSPTEPKVFVPGTFSPRDDSSLPKSTDQFRQITMDTVQTSIKQSRGEGHQTSQPKGLSNQWQRIAGIGEQPAVSVRSNIVRPNISTEPANSVIRKNQPKPANSVIRNPHFAAHDGRDPFRPANNSTTVANSEVPSDAMTTYPLPPVDRISDQGEESSFVTGAGFESGLQLENQDPNVQNPEPSEIFQPSNRRPDNDFQVRVAEHDETNVALGSVDSPVALEASQDIEVQLPGVDHVIIHNNLPATPVPEALAHASHFVLAGQPRVGDSWNHQPPQTDHRASPVEAIVDDFSPDPIDDSWPYDPYEQMHVYEGKTLNATQRPLVELGRPWYQLGQLSPGYSWFGKHNNIAPQFLVYGDARTAIASNTQNGDNVSQIAFELNLDFDLKLTSTERFHMFMAPLDDGQNQNTRWLLDDDEFVENYDADIDFGYFEGDFGAIVGGFTNQTMPFDLPFAIGVMPLLLQNGVWMEDAFLGFAATIPARNSPRLNISNMDITFFAGYDKINSDAFPGDDSAARMYGVASFVEALNGYLEIDYAFLEDRSVNDRSYHNIGLGYTRRFGRLLSNSTRIIVNAGQSTDVVANTADGVLLLSENSLITGAPSTVVPYMNFFVGFDRPQSAARAAAAGGVLRNTGILFESDGMTNYPTLDPTANDTYGGAFGLNLLAEDFSQQLVVEFALLGVMGEDTTRNVPGAQSGVGFRYQLPLNNSVIFRADGMYGYLEDRQDIRGLRFELRKKY